MRQSKERLRRLLNRRDLGESKRAEKEEILQWFLVWLESPGLFRDWFKARTREVEKPVCGAAPEPE